MLSAKPLTCPYRFQQHACHNSEMSARRFFRVFFREPPKECIDNFAAYVARLFADDWCHSTDRNIRIDALAGCASFANALNPAHGFVLLIATSAEWTLQCVRGAGNRGTDAKLDRSPPALWNRLDPDLEVHAEESHDPASDFRQIVPDDMAFRAQLYESGDLLVYSPTGYSQLAVEDLFLHGFRGGDWKKEQSQAKGVRGSASDMLPCLAARLDQYGKKTGGYSYDRNLGWTQPVELLSAPGVSMHLDFVDTTRDVVHLADDGKLSERRARKAEKERERKARIRAEREAVGSTAASFHTGGAGAGASACGASSQPVGAGAGSSAPASRDPELPLVRKRKAEVASADSSNSSASTSSAVPCDVVRWPAVGTKPRLRLSNGSEEDLEAWEKRVGGKEARPPMVVRAGDCLYSHANSAWVREIREEHIHVLLRVAGTVVPKWVDVRENAVKNVTWSDIAAAAYGQVGSNFCFEVGVCEAATKYMVAADTPGRVAMLRERRVAAIHWVEASLSGASRPPVCTGHLYKPGALLVTERSLLERLRNPTPGDASQLAKLISCGVPRVTDFLASGWADLEAHLYRIEYVAPDVEPLVTVFFPCYSESALAGIYDGLERDCVFGDEACDVELDALKQLEARVQCSEESFLEEHAASSSSSGSDGWSGAGAASEPLAPERDSKKRRH